MNIRAQEIRFKRLRERLDEEETEINEVIEHESVIIPMAEVEAYEKAKAMRDWVLDMFEKPTRNNTADTVLLIRNLNTNQIYVGPGLDGSVDKKYGPDVIKQLAKMFKAEKGYFCDCDEDYSYIIISIR